MAELADGFGSAVGRLVGMGLSLANGLLVFSAPMRWCHFAHPPPLRLSPLMALPSSLPRSASNRCFSNLRNLNERHDATDEVLRSERVRVSLRADGEGGQKEERGKDGRGLSATKNVLFLSRHEADDSPALSKFFCFIGIQQEVMKG